MTPDVPPMKREDLEAKVTALLLGELPADEAALLRELIARDAGLARLHDRLKLTLELLRETTAAPAPAPSAPLKLSPVRREKLLAHFKTVTPKEFAPPPRRKISWPVAVAAVFAVGVILTGLLTPRLGGVKSKSLGGKSSFFNLSPLVSSISQDKAKKQIEAATVETRPEVLKSRADRGPDVRLKEMAAVERSTTSGIVLPAPPPASPPPETPLSFGGGYAAEAPLQKPNAFIGRYVFNAPMPQESNQSVYSLQAVGHINVAQDSNFVTLDLVTLANTVTTAAPPVAGSVPVLGSTPAFGALFADKESKKTANYDAAKDAGQTLVSADDKTATNTGEVLSHLFDARNGPGGGGGVGGTAVDFEKRPSTVAGRSALAHGSEQHKTSERSTFADNLDAGLRLPALPPPTPQPEVQTRTNIFSTFSLNVSDASFKLAQASLQNGVMPDAASIRSEEFINAFDYRDPEPAPGAPIGFAWERAGYPFAHNRDLLRFSVKTAAQGRQNGRPLNLVLLLDKSGSMERADRVAIIQQALRVLASQLLAKDTLSVVVFARTARLWVDGVPGSQAGAVATGLSSLTPEGGTNLEDAMKLAYAAALRHYLAGGENRVVLLTDGAANLGNVEPEALRQKVEANRRQGITLDCFGVGWEGYNDNLMETLSRSGNGRYGFINTPEEAATEFAGKLAGALRVAASDVKVQVEFNPNRVTAYRQMGYARHQLTKEQFRDNTVAAAQIGAAESGNALYTVEINPAGDGPLCTVRVRFRAPGATDYQEHAWDVPYTGTAATLDKASPAMRLAAAAAAFSEWLASSPYAGQVTPDQLLAYLRGVPQVYGADARPAQLEWMIRQAKSSAGK